MLKLLTVSNNAPRKNLHWCFGAAEILRQGRIPFKWTFVGPRDVNRVWGAFGNSCVELINWEPNLCKLYKKADLFVLPSEDEGFGMVFLESILCGTPILCKADGGVGHLIDMLGGGGQELIFESSADVAGGIESMWFNYIKPKKKVVTESVLERAITIFDRETIRLSWMRVLHG